LVYWFDESRKANVTGMIKKIDADSFDEPSCIATIELFLQKSLS
jgi:hypothetical protein